MPERRRPETLGGPARPVEPLRPGERDRLLGAFRALADPSRLEILRILAGQRTPVCANDVVERVGLSQPTVSHHLKVLREAGLVTASRLGIWVFYEARPSAAVLLAAARGATRTRKG